MAELRRTRSVVDRRIDRQVRRAMAAAAGRSGGAGPTSMLTGVPDLLALATDGVVRREGTRVDAMALATSGITW